MPFNYFVFGAAVAEVELDCLTGDWHCLRSDVVIDVGNPINPAIDIGQVEGGFVQVCFFPCNITLCGLLCKSNDGSTQLRRNMASIL